MPDQTIDPCPDCRFGHGQQNGCPPADLLAQARDYIAAVEASPPRDGVPEDQGGWSFATSMSDNPHHYTVRQRAWAASPQLGAGHEALFRLVRDHHWRRRWHGRYYRTVSLDGYDYWIIQNGDVVNRKATGRAGWDDEPATLF